MGAGNFGSPVQLLIIFTIVLLLFGGKRLRNIGGDLGGAIKGFKQAMATPEADKDGIKVAQETPLVLDSHTQREKSHSQQGG